MLSVIGRAHATEIILSRQEIDELPAIKAYAYTFAIEEYCFAEKRVGTSDLTLSALLQSELVGNGALETAFQRAAIHLRGDQNACAPATAFVARVAADAGDMYQRLLATKAAAAKAQKEADAAAAKAEEAATAAKAEETLRSQIADCGTSLERAKSLMAEARPLKSTSFNQSFERCLVTVPDKPEHTNLRTALIATLSEVRAKLAIEKQVEDAREAARKKEVEKVRQEKLAEMRLRREKLETVVIRSNKRTGKRYSPGEFCVYTLVPKHGERPPSEDKVQEVMEMCLEGLDPASEEDFIRFIKQRI